MKLSEFVRYCEARGLEVTQAVRMVNGFVGKISPKTKPADKDFSNVFVKTDPRTERPAWYEVVITDADTDRFKPNIKIVPK